jgi:ferric-dicitrate binding protein FerR (iron transport regulator)
MSGHAGKEAVASIYAPAGSRVSFTLPDGSEGMLNSGSTLTYRMPFSSDRAVSLTGEAWFEVAHDEKYPFVIEAGDLDLTVLGTTFNVSAYPEEDYIEVVLENGKVLVNCGQYKEGMIMSPSERLVYENGKVTRSRAEPAKYSSWTEGKLIFRSDSMSEVARRIERWYNVQVELMDEDLEKYSFRATFEDDPLEEVLKCLSMTSPIRYEITPRQLTADSVYSKSIVKIFLK